MMFDLKTYRLKLHTICPVHIGGGDENPNLSPMGYMRENDTILVLDPGTLPSILSRDRLTEICGELSRGGERRLQQLLKPDEARRLQSKLSTRIDAPHLAMERNIEIASCMKTSTGAYVPGSTIKGTIRNAILARWIKRQGLADTIQKGDQIDQKCYRPNTRNSDMQADMLRVLAIKDALLLGDQKGTAVYEAAPLPVGDKQGPTVVMEAIPAERDLYGSLSIDYGLAQELLRLGTPDHAWNWLKSKEALLQALYFQADRTLRHWIDRINKLCIGTDLVDDTIDALNDLLAENLREAPLIYVGKFGGWFSKTIASATVEPSDSDEDLLVETPAYHDLARRTSSGRKFPSTFRVALDRESKFLSLIGWCKLTL